MEKQSIDGMSTRTAVSHFQPNAYPTSAGPPVGAPHNTVDGPAVGNTDGSKGTKQEGDSSSDGFRRSWSPSQASPNGTHGELAGKGKVEHDENDAIARAKATGMEPGSAARKKLERRLKWKLDLRFSILVSQLDAFTVCQLRPPPHPVIHWSHLDMWWSDMARKKMLMPGVSDIFVRKRDTRVWLIRVRSVIYSTFRPLHLLPHPYHMGQTLTAVL